MSSKLIIKKIELYKKNYKLKKKKKLKTTLKHLKKIKMPNFGWEQLKLCF